jgi:hypothetical protein
MNKLIASTAFVVATALSGAAFADNPTDVNAGGNAQQIGHLGPIQVTQEFSPTFINPSTSVVNPGEKKIRFVNSFINYAGQLGIKSANGAITTAGVAPPGWVDKVNYKATATFGASVATYTTNGSVVPTLGVNKQNAAAGPWGFDTVNVSLLLIPSALPAIAGAYNDVVTVVLGAGV